MLCRELLQSLNKLSLRNRITHFFNFFRVVKDSGKGHLPNAVNQLSFVLSDESYLYTFLYGFLLSIQWRVNSFVMKLYCKLRLLNPLHRAVNEFNVNGLTLFLATCRVEDIITRGIQLIQSEGVGFFS